MSRPSSPVVTVVRFTVENHLVVADPCYIDSGDEINGHTVLTPGLGIVFPDCAGEWTAEIRTNFDQRVERLELKRDGYNVGGGTVEGHNAVDSGQMYAGCTTNTPLDYDALLDAYKGPDDVWVNRDMLAFGGGVVCGTGYGDGMYPVVVKRDAQCGVVAVTVLFTDDGDDA